MIYFNRQIKFGKILIQIDEDINISGVWFDGQKYYPILDKDALFIENLTEKEIEDKMINKNHLNEIYNLISEFDKQMSEYEDGKRRSFDLPLAPVGGEFRQEVWKELLKIPMGQTITYGQIGKKVALLQGKKSMSAQAIGGAVGHNPISIIIPCHRVIGSNGKLTGYAGGIEKKIAILRHEGAKIYKI